MPRSHSLSVLRSAAALGAGCALVAVLAACDPSAPAAADPTAKTTATPSRSATPAAKCAYAAGTLKGSSITVCPAAAPVGAVVHITIKGCSPVDPAIGLPEAAAAAMFFVGPGSWLGTDGGGGANVPFSPRTGSTQATATFTIPATYTGGDVNGPPYPTLRTTPGNNYLFSTDPAGECTVHFTVTTSPTSS